MILDRIFGRPKQANEGWSSGGWGNSSSGRVQTLAGSRVDEDIALTLSAVCACSRIVVEPISTMPLHLYKRTNDDGREKASDKSLFDILDVSPNSEMGAAAFREGRALHQLNWGNGFAEIVRDPMTDEVSELWPIHPSRVRPSLQNSGVDANEFPYLVRNSDGTYVAMRRSELLHIPGMLTEDGIWGKGVIAYARETIGAGFSIERHTYAYWNSGGQPKGVVKLPAMLLKSKEQRAEYRAEWKQFHGSPDSNEVMLMPPEGDYSPIPISNEDSQFLDTKKLNVAQIAQFYRVPVYMLGIFEMAAARASIEAQGIEFVMYTLMPWLKKIEEQLNLKLLTRKQRNRYFIEHNVTALLRGDINARFNAYKTAIANGWMTINQVCRLENLPTIGPAGDVNYIQLNMTTAQAMFENPPQPADPSGGKPAAQPAEDAADGDGVVEDPKATDPKALAAWTRDAAQQLQARDAGKRTHKIKSVLLHQDNGPLKAAARKCLFDVLERFGVKEANAAGRHAGRVKDMMAAIENGASSIPDGNITTWADGFYPKHQQQIAAALVTTGEMLIAIGVPFDAKAVAERCCTDARLAMEHAFYSDTPETFAKRLAEWPAAFATAGCAQVLGDE